MINIITRYKNRIMKRYLNKDFPFRVRLLNVTLLSAFALGIIETISSAIYGAPLISIIVTLILTLMMHFILIIMEKTKKYEICATIAVGLCNLIMMPLIYFTSGGKDGGMSLFFTLGIIFTFLLLEKKLLIISVIIELINYEAIIAISYYYPQYVVPFKEKSIGFTEIC